MILSYYNQTNANRLIRLSLPTVSEPFSYKVLWIRSISIASFPKGINKNPHQHSFFEVHYILSGKTQYEDSSGIIRDVGAGEAILFPPESMHTLKYCSDDLIKICLAFSCDVQNPPFDALFKNGTFIFDINKKMEVLFETILEEAELCNIFSYTLIQNSIFELICNLLRGISPTEKYIAVDHPESDTRIALAKQYIKDNPNRFLTCNEVAQYCHFNAKYLNRIFKSTTGMTLLSYIHKQKVLQIQELLEHSSLSLEEISQTLGFRNEYYFSSFFKRCGGITPYMYRRLIKKNDSLP